MRFSVVIPAFEAEATLDRCFESLEHQTLKDFEVIFVSDDQKYYNVEARFPQLNIIEVQTRGYGTGPGAARNIGIALSSGEYVTFVDSDDSIPPNRLEEFASELGVSPVVSDYPKIFDFKGEINKVNTHKPGLIPFSEFLKFNFPIKIAHRNTKKLFFNEDLRFAEDTIYNARCIRENGGALKILGSCFYSYYSREGSITDNEFDEIDAQYQKLLNYVSQSDFFGDDKELVTRSFWFKRELNSLYFKYQKKFGGMSFQKFIDEVI